MRRNLFKKTLAFLMAGVFLVSATGCNSGNSKKETVEIEKDTSNAIYQGEEVSLNGIKGSYFENLSVAGDRAYIQTIEYLDETAESRVNHLYSVSLEGNDVKEIPLPELKKEDYLYRIMVSENALYYLVLEEAGTFLGKMDMDGNAIFKEDVSDIVNPDSDEITVHGMAVDKEGRIAFLGNQKVILLDENGKLSGEIETDSYIEALAATKDGRLFCCIKAGENETIVKTIDFENKKWDETYSLGAACLEGNNPLLNGAEYDFYYKTGDGVYGYDLNQKKAVLIVDYVASYMTQEDSWYLYPVAKDTLIGLEMQNNVSRLILYHKVDASKIKEKQTITYAAPWTDETAKKAVVEFNKSNPRYQIELIDYSEEEDVIAKINMDITTGHVPDIMDITGLPVKQYAAKGLFEDLLPYIENDPELNTDDFIPSVFEAMKTDGKLYFVSPNFGISTLIGKTEDVGEGAGWTFEEMKTVLDAKGDGVRLFVDNNKMKIAKAFRQVYSDFINWETGECYFDTPEFKAILELCNQGTNKETDFIEDEYELVNGGKVFLYRTPNITMEEMQAYKGLFGSDVTCIGYPSKDGQGTYFSFNQRYAISSKSKVKEGAWKFVRKYLTKEYQGNIETGCPIPTRNDCYRMMVRERMATENYVDELGQEMEPFSGSYGWGDFEVKFKPLTQEEVDAFTDLINRTTKTADSNSMVMSIIEEEVQPYFAGDKNVDETAKIIQGRVTTYINENK